MLKFYRKHLKLIIWLIVLSFALWGVGTLSVSQKASSSYIGSINGKKVSQKEFLLMFRYFDLITQADVARENAASEERLGEAYKPVEPLSIEQLRNLTWQAIVLSREAKHQGIRVGDQEVKDEVQQLFISGGKFDEKLYRNWVEKYSRAGPRDFEEAVRKHLITKKIQLTALAGIPEEERGEKWVEWLRNLLKKYEIRDYVQEEERKD